MNGTRLNDQAGFRSTDRQCRQVDRLTAILSATTLALAAADLLCGYLGLAVATAAITPLALAIRRINRRGRAALAAQLLILSANALIFVFAVLLGKRALVQNYFFPAVVLPILVCRPAQRHCLVGGTLAPLALYALLEATGYAPLGPGLRMGAPGWNPGANVAACFTLCFLIILSFHRTSKEAERAILAEQSKLLAASKLSALGEMAGGIAHEINNPLSNIQLLSTQLRSLLRRSASGREDHEPAADDASRESAFEIIDRIHETIQRIVIIIRALGAFSRDSGRDPMTLESVGKIVHETAGLCREKFANHGVELRLSLKDAAVKIECNPVQISQILVNLLNNAYDAVSGPRGPLAPAERWVLIESADRGDYVEICVQDSGPGVSPEAGARIFEPFFTTKQAGQGTGLGLSVSSNIAQAHHGELTLERGSRHTRFRLLLPKRQPIAADAGSPPGLRAELRLETGAKPVERRKT